MSLATLFDYAALDAETRIVVQQKTGEIRERVRRTRQDVIEIGERLIEVKERLGHGNFGKWLRAEFDWADRTAQSFMCVAEAFKSAIIADLDITPTALQGLAAPSVPDEARSEAIRRARDGEHIGSKEAKEIAGKHIPTPTPKPAPQPDLFAAESAKQQRNVESRRPDPKPVTKPEEEEWESEEEDSEDEGEKFDLTDSTSIDEEAAEKRRNAEQQWERFIDYTSQAIVTLTTMGGIVHQTRNLSLNAIKGNIIKLKQLAEVASEAAGQLEEAYFGEAKSARTVGRNRHQ
jgi:outer membrane biosynthesis protein TonB